MIWQVQKTIVVLALIAAVGWGIYLETGWVTGTCLGLLFALVLGIDRRTRFDPEEDALAKVRKMVQDMEPDPDRMPGSEEEEESNG